MMNAFVVLLSVFTLLEIASCRPSTSVLGGFTKESRIELPGSERISKRSAESLNTFSINTAAQDASLEAMGGSSVSETIELGSNEGFEQPIGFRPIPVVRKRSVNQMESSKSIGGNQETHKRRSRSLNTDDDSDEMKTAENGLIFLPHFRSRNGVVRTQRSRRSAQDAVKTEGLPNVGALAEDLEAAETIIFRPVFRSQLRPVRSVMEEEDLKGEDMVVAANGLIFRPLFKTRQRDAGSA